MKQDTILKRLTDTVYGGLNMSWPVVIIYAVLTAVVNAVFLIIPAFKETSFYYMGVTFEAWIFFAVIIMANCRTPLDSALKTFGEAAECVVVIKHDVGLRARVDHGLCADAERRAAHHDAARGRFVLDHHPGQPAQVDAFFVVYVIVHAISFISR